MDDETSFEDQILKHLEELIVEMIVRELHCETLLMLGPQYIISPHEPNRFLDKDSLSKHDQ